MNIINRRIKEQDKLLNICNKKHNNNMYELLNRRKRSKKGLIFTYLIPLIMILLICISIIVMNFVSTSIIFFFIVIIFIALFSYLDYITTTPLSKLFELNQIEYECVSKFLNTIVSYEEIENFDIINFEYVQAESNIEPMIIGFYFMTFDDKMHFCKCSKKMLSKDIEQILKVTHYSNCLRNKKIEYECM